RRSPIHDKDILFSTTLLKAFLSSPQACLETVENRLKTIQHRLADTKISVALRSDLESDQQGLEDSKERLELVIASETAKLQELGRYLDSIGWNGKTERRVIIFSERIRTLDVLRDFLVARYKLKDSAWRLFHAGLPDTEQMQIVEDFGKQDAPVRVLLATDVASEGVNLHFFCNHLVHFDIPSSLITLEQRNGRSDGDGQEQAPHIVYLVTTGKAAEVKDDLTILVRLIDKEQAAHKTLGDAAPILRLYAARQEEDHVEAGLSAGQKPEQ